jgi:hypothetical protein
MLPRCSVLGTHYIQCETKAVTAGPNLKNNELLVGVFPLVHDLHDAKVLAAQRAFYRIDCEHLEVRVMVRIN